MRIQEKNRLRDLEEKKRQESLLHRKRLLREKVMLECKSSVKRPRSSSLTPDKKSDPDLQGYNQKQQKLASKAKLGIIEKTQLRRQKIIEDNNKKFREPTDPGTTEAFGELQGFQATTNGPKTQPPADPGSKFIRLSRKNSTSPKQTVPSKAHSPSWNASCRLI